MSLLEKIREIEEEIRKTQYNKATEGHIGRLKAKLARLRAQLIEKSKKGPTGPRFDVKKSGDASVALIGFPSVGKSSLLNALTGANAETGAYAFTTLKCIPGIMEYNGAKIQILDLPGILEGAHAGLGRGREVLSVARTSDLLLLVVDVFNSNVNIILKELWNIGIRVNQRPPDITVTVKHRGGVKINATVKLTKISEETIKIILNEYGIHNAEIVLREDITADQLIDVLAKNRVYLPAIAVLNKSDLVNKEYITELRKNINMEIIPVSARTGQGIEELKQRIYEKLDFIRIYTRSRGVRKEFDDDIPIVMRRGAKVRDVCQKLHRDMLRNFRYAMVWGKSAKHPGQKVGLDHILEDGDRITIVTHTGYSK